MMVSGEGREKVAVDSIEGWYGYLPYVRQFLYRGRFLEYGFGWLRYLGVYKSIREEAFGFGYGHR